MKTLIMLTALLPFQLGPVQYFRPGVDIQEALERAQRLEQTRNIPCRSYELPAAHEPEIVTLTKDTVIADYSSHIEVFQCHGNRCGPYTVEFEDPGNLAIISGLAWRPACGE